MKLLVRRYVTAEQRKRDDFGITEDDVMEIRQDISTLRYELIDIFSQNGMKTPHVKPSDGGSACLYSYFHLISFHRVLFSCSFETLGKLCLLVRNNSLCNFKLYKMLYTMCCYL